MSNRIKILFVLNHFQFSDGVAATLRSLIQNIDKDKYELHLLPLYKLDHDFLTPVESMVKVHRGFGFYFRGMSVFISRIPLKWLYKLLIREKFDLEVAYQYGLSTKIISISPNPNKICWMHGYDSDMVLREYYKRFARIISVSQIGSKKLFSEGFVNSDYCYNIIDEQNILEKSAEQISISKSKRYLIVTICRLSPEKALLREIKCILRANEIMPNFELWIIGDGAERETLETYIESNHLSDSIKLLGQQHNPYKYLKEADLYLCGSLHEGFNTACQEAAILGIPVVSTDVDGAEELIDLAGCGEVIPNDEQAITECLTAILFNDNLVSSWKQIAFANRHRFYKQSRIKKIETELLKATSYGQDIEKK